jgi:glycyl-tRNA synthetase
MQRLNKSQLDQLLLKRFFFSPSFEIYGGIAGLYDYGPYACALQNNILQLWRLHFVLQEDMMEIDCTNLTPESVFKTSGHVERFADYMVKDIKNGDIFRADHLVKNVLTSRLQHKNSLGVPATDKAFKNATALSEETTLKYQLILETVFFFNLAR